MKKTFTLALSLCFGSLFSQVQTYTVPGTYSFTVPASVTTLTIEVIGGGGSGGGNGTGGGGGGGYAKGAYTVTAGAVLSVKVGSGGSGAAAGTSSVSGFISATGGVNGVSVSNPSVGGGGAGGVGSGGTMANYTGGTGGGGYYTYFGGGGAGAAGSTSNGTNGGNTPAYTPGNCLTPGGSAGTGGGAPAGNGGKGAGFTNSSCSATDPAASGSNFGGGGGGGNGIGSAPGTGAGGYCQITWLGCTPPAAPGNTTPASNQTICATKTTTLTVSGTALNWYSSPTSTTSLATGTAYTTPTLSAGSYTYYAASTNTCSEGPRTAITVSVNPSPVITANTGSVCSGQSYTFVPTGASTYTYVVGGGNVQTPTIPSSIPSATVSYVVNGTSAAGCVGTGSLSVVVYSLPSVTVTGTPIVLCLNLGLSAKLTASGASTYTWNTGPTTNTISVSPTVNTTYTVTGKTTSSGCTNLATYTQSVAICDGVEDLTANETVLSIYPNPGKGDVTIVADRDMTISLVNNLGQVVKTVSINASNNYKADISNLANGMYSIIDESNQQKIRQKIVVAK